ncbi:unnamed protein product [Rotaria magnacalcarata]|nr:unnamed protein product [Rotaria magnacalcarata]CAF4841063.1 unnamed protein product [Rotaria magnacalcarata]
MVIIAPASIIQSRAPSFSLSSFSLSSKSSWLSLRCVQKLKLVEQHYHHHRNHHLQYDHGYHCSSLNYSKSSSIIFIINKIIMVIIAPASIVQIRAASFSLSSVSS